MPSHVKLCGSFSSFFFLDILAAWCVSSTTEFSLVKGNDSAELKFVSMLKSNGESAGFRPKMFSATFSKLYLLLTHFSCSHFNYIRSTNKISKTFLSVCQLNLFSTLYKILFCRFCNKHLSDILTMHDINTHFRITHLF